MNRGMLLNSCVAIVALSVASTQAHAQDAESTRSASNEDVRESTGSGLEEIVVTANRREASLQQVPISVTAITAASLERQGISNPRDLTRTIPNLTVSQTASNFQPIIRGVGTSVSGAGAESSIAVYMNGVYIPDMTGSFQDLLAVERIEVLRGPQGTLFGRNATGGLINIITKDPSFDPAGQFRVRFGRFDTFTAQGYVTTGLSDKFAVDLAGSYTRSDGWIKDLVRGGTENNYKTYSARMGLLFQPSDSARIKASITREHRDDPTSLAFYVVDRNTTGRRPPNQNVLIAEGPFNSAVDVDRYIFAGAWRGDVQTHFDLGGVNLETTTSYSSSKAGFSSDIEVSPIPIQVSFQRQYTKTFTNEVRLLSEDRGRLEWILGAYYFSNKSRSPTRIHVPNLQGPAVLNFYATINTESVAGFGEATFHITDQLSLIGGMRYTWERITFNQVSAGVELFDVSSSNTRFSPRISLKYDIAPRTNVYATYSRGFKGGAYNAVGASPVPVKPEDLEAFEIGLKSDVSRQLRINASVFRYNYSDLQASARDPVTNLFLLQNAANARMTGGEIELTAEPTEGLTFRGAVAYTDAKFTEFPAAANFIPTLDPVTGVPIGGNTQISPDVAGRQIPRAPKITVSAGMSYIRPLGDGNIGGSVDLFSSSRVWWDTANTISQPAYETLSAELFWSPNDALRFSIWGTNLTNAIVARQISQAAAGTFRVNEAPRQYGISASYKF